MSARQLIVLRHAKSDWDSETLMDFDRPLAKRGAKDAPRMGKWLHEQGLIPDHVLSSPAERAKQTTLRVCAALGIAEADIHWDAQLYAASRETLCRALADCPPTAGRVLLVGHNPGLEELLIYLCGTVPLAPDGKLLPTASAAQLMMPEDWTRLAPGSAHLIGITRPRSLT
jgi:phosphohistidine phosphatase